MKQLLASLDQCIDILRRDRPGQKTATEDSKKDLTPHAC
jgi:hypothetical protein